jgi:hypothetical protein
MRRGDAVVLGRRGLAHLSCNGRDAREAVHIIASLTIFCLGTWSAACAQPAKETTMNMAHSQTGPRTRARAKAKITVQSSEAKPFDQTASPALMEIRLSETFTGDIDGESTVRALQVLRDDRSASLVSMQRLRPRVGRGCPGGTAGPAQAPLDVRARGTAK